MEKGFGSCSVMYFWDDLEGKKNLRTFDNEEHST